MPMNLKEGDRYVVNHGEDPTTVDFGDYVSLAEKEDADMAGRRDLARGSAAEWIEQKLSLDNENEGTSMAGIGGPTATREGDSKGWKQGRWLRAAVATAVAGLRPRLGCGWKDLGEKDLVGLHRRLEHARGQGEEMMLLASDRGRDDAIVGQRKKEAGAAGRRRNNKEGWGSNDAMEIGVDLVLVLVQHGNSRFRRGRGALNIFHDRGGRGKMRELSAEEVATATGTSEAMVPAISQKYLAEESTTVDRWG
ncbi:hypothetical protein B296_00024400 [Ensete ventricosum]|uniref:Uncharacterized protein n=1 Tax=Ensete ventricosum TaxID=4639 RepID=A0A426YUH4_ENSVE|nr:hypothetical protein B296_00024400 [Ensete ventricosum]